MIATKAQAAKIPVPERLFERLTGLGVSLASIDVEARLVHALPAQPLDAILLHSPAFAVALRKHEQSLAERSGELVNIWPGVRVMALHAHRRRRNGRRGETAALAMFLDRRFLDSDQLRMICDIAEVDFVTIRREASQTVRDPEHVQPIAESIAWMHADALELDRRYTELQNLSQQLGESYEELSLLYKFSTSLSLEQPPVQFCNQALRDLQQVAGLRWMSLQLTHDDPRLNDLAGRLLTAGDYEIDHGSLENIGRALLSRYGGTREAVVVQDVDRSDLPGLSSLTHSLLVVPLRYEDKPLGVLFGGDKLDDSHITTVDSKLCNSLASTLAILLGNIMLYDDMQSMFMGTLHALTSSIDAKDSYTHGHSERVALMSRMLAEAAGLDEPTVERVYLAGLVHDVGKIGVPESVLTKPGPLTDEEFELVKLHPEIGGRILQDIRQMEDLIPGVLYHHERWDGRGYPSKLAGMDIPLFGRVICLADSFDAMSSNRAYRKALDLNEVLGEIERCAGVQFDPDLAKVFVKLDFDPFFAMIRRHQEQELQTTSAVQQYRNRLQAERINVSETQS